MSLWDEPTIYYALQQHFCGAFVYFTLSLGGIQSLSGISYVAKSQLIQSFQTYTAVRKQWRARSPNSIYFLMENMTIARCMREQMHRWGREKKTTIDMNSVDIAVKPFFSLFTYMYFQSYTRQQPLLIHNDRIQKKNTHHSLAIVNAGQWDFWSIFCVRYFTWIQFIFFLFFSWYRYQCLEYRTGHIGCDMCASDFYTFFK